MEKQVGIYMIKKMKDILYEINPIIKIIIVILITITATLDRNPYFSVFLFLLTIIIVKLFSKMTILEYLYKIKVVVLMAAVYIFFIVLSKWLSKETIDFEYIFALAFRFVIIGSYSFIFIQTVNPKELVMALIKYLKLSERMGFAFLSAYRFLPTFSLELEQIKFSHATRGIGDSGIFSAIKNIKTYTVPLLVNAVRRGSRLSISMESRGFGKYDKRVYYSELTISSLDKKALVLYLLIYIISFVIFMHFNLINISFIQ